MGVIKWSIVNLIYSNDISSSFVMTYRVLSILKAIREVTSETIVAFHIKSNYPL